MSSYQRADVERLATRLDEHPHHLIALFGPRQSGKTTIVSQALEIVSRPSVHYQLDTLDINVPDPLLDDTTIASPRRPDMKWLVDAWHDARRKADSSPNGFILVLDEIQAVPDWTSIIKGLWDADRAVNRELHVVVLGSAPMPIQSSLSESLAGRFELLTTSHWSFVEMRDAFGFELDQYLFFGGYPGCARFVQDEKRWRQHVVSNFIISAIEKDILAMTRVDKPALLKQFFEIGALYSGQILSYNRMLGHLPDAGNTTTLTRYLDLLSTCELLTGFRKYAPAMLRTRESSPKLNICNTALLTATSDYSFDQARADRSYWGSLVQSAVGAHVFNTAPSNVKIYYWHEKVGRKELAVDFVLQQGPLTIGIEVKSGIRLGPLRGSEEFRQKFHPHRTLLVGDGGVHIGEFLATPVIRWFDG